MEVNFSEFEEWCTPEITEGECGDCGDCEGEDTSLFLRFICAYMNCEENKHAGKLVATLNKTRLPPPPKCGTMSRGARRRTGRGSQITGHLGIASIKTLIGCGSGKASSTL